MKKKFKMNKGVLNQNPNMSLPRNIEQDKFCLANLKSIL